MIKSFSLSRGKAMINFSSKYCKTEAEVLESDAFKCVIKKYFERIDKEYTKSKLLMHNVVKSENIDEIVEKTVIMFKLLTTMTSKEISENFDRFSFLYENKERFNEMLEDIYTYWRNLERYAIVFENNTSEGLDRKSFIATKKDFDDLILDLYRKISINLLLETPSVYRQVSAGTNAGLVLKKVVWPVPEGYESLKRIPFIVNMVLETPFITYPKKNTRSGFFEEEKTNPITDAIIDQDAFLCYPIWVGDLLCFAYCHRDFITHLVSLSNLFEPAKVNEVAGRKPDIMIIFSYIDQRGANDKYYVDDKNDMIVGYVSYDERYDYFGYMKKMILTIHNIKQIKRGNLPIHGSMIKLELNDSSKANIVIMGDSGAGKSESIEALRSLSKEYLSDMTIIFDDMGNFRINPANNKLLAYGTETGAFVRLDDLDEGYAFKQLDRSIFMNPDKINARLISPVSSYEEIMNGEKVDIFLYANNYDEVKENEKSIIRFKNEEEAKKVFIAGKRQAKGTTSEKGLTTSFFANPFGPYQEQELSNILIDKYFKELFDRDIFVGQIKTQLGIVGKEKDGPKEAAIELFDLIKKLNRD